MARIVLVFILFLLHEISLFALRFLWLLLQPQQEWQIRFFNFIYFDIASFLLFFFPMSLFILLAPQKVLRSKIAIPTTFLLYSLPFYLFVFLNTADIIYYTSAQKRITYELFSFTDDLLHYAKDIFSEYFLEFFLIFLWTFIASLSVLKLLKKLKPVPAKQKILTTILFLVVSLFLVRGGFRYKPITPAKAYENVSQFWGTWHLNTGYVLVHYLSAEKDRLISWLPEKEAVTISQKYAFSPKIDRKFLSEDFPFMKQTLPRTPEKKYNIVLIILESFSVPYLEKGNTPFFDSLKNEGIYFENYFANAVRSIEAVPALLSGVPNLFNFSFIGSPYVTHKTPDVGKILQNKGYHTSFFHGARKGSMGFDEYLKAHGISEYYSKEDFPKHKNPEYFDGTWGIYDNYFMDFFLQKIQSFPQPFFTTFFSLSNHHPFKLPPSISKKQGDFHTTLRFTDNTLREFFRKIQKWKGFKNTIFFITADHFTRFQNEDITYPEQHRVPFLIYAPQLLSPKKISYAVSHINFLPTLIDILNLNTEYASFAPSGLDTSAQHYALFRHSNTFIFIQDTLGTELNLLNQKISFLSKKENRWYNVPQETLPAKKLKALAQTHHNTILQGNFLK